MGVRLILAVLLPALAISALILTTTQRSAPFAFGDDNEVTSLATGGQYSCVLDEGIAQCWGSDSLGQLGIGGGGITSGTSFPVPVDDLEGNVQAIAAGNSHTCAITSGGGVKCWGWNRDGQLGAPTTTTCRTAFTCSNFPIDVTGLASGIASIGLGGVHSCAVTTGGELTCWGNNSDSQLGVTTSETCGALARPCSTIPLDVPLGFQVASVAGGSSHTCVLTTSGGVKCWGENKFGQLGDGQFCGLECATPVDVDGLNTGVVAISTRGSHACALTDVGTLKCWGSNSFGKLGNGNMGGFETRPVEVIGMDSGVAVSVGGSHSCAVLTDGSARCWGLNSNGQLGDGSDNNSATPVDVIGTGPHPQIEVRTIRGGNGHTCATTARNGVQCWGANGSFNGHLGTGVGCLVCPVPEFVIGFGPKLPPPTPFDTPTPCPPGGCPVGGVAVDSDSRILPLETTSPDSSVWGLAFGFVAAAGLLTVGGAAWYARKRLIS